MRDSYKFSEKLVNSGDTMRIPAENAKKIRSALSQWAKKHGKKVVTRSVESDSLFGNLDLEIELVDNFGSV